jgi:hypothetical protein
MSLEPHHSVQRAWVGGRGQPGGADGRNTTTSEDSDIHRNLGAIP